MVGGYGERQSARIAGKSLLPGGKVADVARHSGVKRWQVYGWRRKLAAGKLVVPASAMSEPPFAALVFHAEVPVHFRGCVSLGYRRAAARPIFSCIPSIAAAY